MKYNKSNYLGISLKSLHLHWGQHTYKGENYRSYSLARSVRRDGKNSKEIVLKLGKLADEEVEKWKQILAAAKSDGSLVSLSDVFCAKNLDYLDVATVDSYWNRWNFDSCFPSKGKRLIDVADIAKILTINRCIDPCSKSSVPEWFQKTYLALSIEPEKINSSRIYRELDAIEASKESLCAHIISKVRREDAAAVKTLFFDLSTTTFHGSKSPLVCWGRSKQGYDYHAVLALLVTEDGLPLYWEVLSGATPETNTLSWLIKSVGNRFPVGEMTLVFDRGMVSDKNLRYLHEDKRKYISAMDKNQITVFCSFDFKKTKNLNPTQIDQISSILDPIDVIDDDTFLIEDTCNSTDERRYTLVFNSKMFAENQRAREKKIEDFRQYVADMNRILESAINDRARRTTEKKFEDELQKKGLSKYVKVKLDFKYMRTATRGQIERTRTFCAEVIIDEDEKHIDAQLDGFWMLVTNHTRRNSDGTFCLSGKKILQSYRDKFIIEASFRDIKSAVEVAPVHVWKEKHVKAHYTICVLAHLIRKSLSIELSKEPGGSSKSIISADSILDSLSTVKLNCLAANKINETKLSFTQPSKIVLDLLKRLRLQDLTSPSRLKDINTLDLKMSV